MSKNQKLHATVRIGGALDASFKKGLSTTKSKLTDIGSSLKDLNKRQVRLKKASNHWKKMGRDTSRFDDEIQGVNRSLDELKRKQEAWKDVASKQRGVGSAFRTMKLEIGSLTKKAVVSFGTIGSAMGLLGHNVATNSEELNQYAKRLGTTTEWLSRTQYAASQFGVTNDALIDGVKELSLRADEFALNGNGSAAEAFERLGLSQSEIKGLTKDTEELFRVVKARMTSVTNVAAKQRIADELFGGTGGEQFIEMLGISERELEQLRKQSDAVGATVTKQQADMARAYSKSWRELGGVFTGIKNTVGAQLMPVIGSAMNNINSWAKENQDTIHRFGIEFGVALNRAIPVIGDMAKGLYKTATVIGDMVSRVATMVGGFENLGIIVGAVFASKAIGSVVAFGASIFKVGSAMVGLMGVLPTVIAGVKAFTLVLMANPIGLIIGGIATAAALIIANWEPIKGFFSNLWASVKASFSDVGTSFKTLFSWSPLGMLVKAWRPALDWISSKMSWVGDMASSIKSLFSDGGGVKKVGGTLAATGLAASMATAPAYAETPQTFQAKQTISQVAPTKATSIDKRHIDNRNFTIQVTGSGNPGEDAKRIREEIKRLDAQEERSSLYDGGSDYGY